MPNIQNIFKPDYEHYEGVRRINVYVIRLIFAMMFFCVGTEAWNTIFTHEGPWNPTIAVAWCSFAAYSTLAILGIFHTLRMLPIMLYMIFYKTLWLVVVAYPLWATGTLKGSPAEEMAYVFSGVIVPILFMPWKYVFKNYILMEKYRK